jgi:predicted negative regulator of RcsB-dependent stress response
MGALVSARAQLDAGDSKTAQVQLAWAAEKAAEEGLRDLARLRVAIVLLDDKAYDEAAKQLAKEPSAPFRARYGELRGDVYAAQGKTGEARAAYEAAIKLAEAAASKGSGAGDAASAGGSNYREMLRTKLEQLGGGK